MSEKNILKTKKNRIEKKAAYLVLLCVFLAICIVGAIPYYASGTVESFIDGVFESVSAFTTTNATIVPVFSSMPNWLRLYRAICEWIGGAFSLVVLSLALKSFSYDENGLEVSSQDAGLYRSGIRIMSIVKRLLLTYTILTVVCTLVLWILGNKPGDSLILAFGTISTGGFPFAGISSKVSNATLTALLVFMVLTCISYTAYYHIIKKHFDKVFNSTELYGFLVMIGVGCIVVIAGLYLGGEYDFRQAVFNGVYHTISYATTNGTNLVATLNWPALSRIALRVVSLVGSCSVSAGSGIRVMRIIILVKLIARGFTTRIHPLAVSSIKFNGKKVSGSMISAVFSYFLLFVATYVLATFAFSFEATSLEEAFILTNSLITNLGGIYTGFYSVVTKIIMCIVMLLGRLEFYFCMIPFAFKEK